MQKGNIATKPRVTGKFIVFFCNTNTMQVKANTSNSKFQTCDGTTGTFPLINTFTK
jgi:hypothetical protein